MFCYYYSNVLSIYMQLIYNEWYNWSGPLRSHHPVQIETYGINVQRPGRCICTCTCILKLCRGKISDPEYIQNARHDSEAPRSRKSTARAKTTVSTAEHAWKEGVNTIKPGTCNLTARESQRLDKRKINIRRMVRGMCVPGYTSILNDVMTWLRKILH